ATIRTLQGGSMGEIALGARDLTVDQTADHSFAGRFSGSGALIKTGASTLTLTGDSSGFAGSTGVEAGVLQVGSNGSGTLNGDMTVASGATLKGGGGTITGNVSVDNGGILSGGQNGGGLTMNALAQNTSAITNVSLATPTTANAVFTITDATPGALMVNGTLNVTGEAGYGPGVYRVFASPNADLTNAGLALGSASSISGYTAALDTGARYVDVQLTASGGGGTGGGGDGGGGGTPTPTPALQYWSADGTSRGSGGNWTSASLWLSPASDSTGPWAGNTGVFAGPAGTVAVDGRQSFGTLEFLTSGYALVTGADGSLDLGSGGRLWAEGAGTIATVSAPLTGSGALTKIGAGTIILSGANTYQGGTVL
ncbi:autotransporter-associated beta strand repeat-containing protein, partial [Xanthobacter sp. V2C-8]|uniref:autotransporter-associated beta strand repeat-containing protein n=2 Tax=Xanthobacter albus TaxID=3119929 RepID=UPI00372CD2A5